MAKILENMTLSDEVFTLYEKPAKVMAKVKQEPDVITQELEALKLSLSALIQTLEDKAQKAQFNLQQQVSQLTFDVVSKLFIERHQDKQALTAHINQALHAVENHLSITLFLHPDDIKALQNQHIKLSIPHGPQLKIMPDTSLTLGGCRIHTPHGEIDAGIDTQIERLKETLITIQGGHYV